MIGNIETILNITINSTSATSVLEKILDFMGKSSVGEKLVVFTPNPEFLVEANRNNEFREILNKADINVPDGIGLVWAGRFLGKPIKERVSGADLVEKLLGEGNRLGWTVGVVGARSGGLSEENVKSQKSNVKNTNQNSKVDEGESQILLERLKKKFPRINFVNLDTKSLPSRQAGLNLSNLKPKTYNLILACHGMVCQEKWIMDNKDKINAKVFMGIGGSLDFLTGFSKRAPLLIRRIGLEWLWRGLQKPGHWQRVWRATVVFLGMVIREKLKILLS